MKIDLEIVTGFLGAGKSALINSLIKETYVKNERILVITLEEGNTVIEVGELEEHTVKHIKYKGDYFLLKEFILEKLNVINIDRVIIEHNSTERIDLLLHLIFSKDFYKVLVLKSIYYIADAKTFKVFITNMEELLLPCIENSNLLILNNCEDIKEVEFISIKNLLLSLNLNAHLIFADNNACIESSLSNSKLFVKSNFRRIKRIIKGYREDRSINEDI